MNKWMLSGREDRANTDLRNWYCVTYLYGLSTPQKTKQLCFSNIQVIFELVTFTDCLLGMDHCRDLFFSPTLIFPPPSLELPFVECMGFHDLLKQSKTRVWLWYVPLSLPYCFFSIWWLLRGEIRNLLFLLNCYRGNLEIEDPPIPCYSLIWQKGGLIEIQTFRVLSSSCL